MAVKKTVKKRRTVKKMKVDSIDSVVASLQANIALSAVNKRAIDKLKKSEASVMKLQKQVAGHQERIEKARNAVANSKTPAAKEKAKIRLNLALSAAREVKTSLSNEVSEQKKAIRLVRSLQKAFASAHTKMLREYDKKAKSLEKMADKPLRRRRTSKKKAIHETA